MIIIILVNLVITYFSVFWFLLTSPVAFCSATMLKLLLFLAKSFWFLFFPKKDELGIFSVLLLSILGRLGNCYKELIISISHCIRYLRRVCILENCHNFQTILLYLIIFILIFKLTFFVLLFIGMKGILLLLQNIFTIFIELTSEAQLVTQTQSSRYIYRQHILKNAMLNNTCFP